MSVIVKAGARDNTDSVLRKFQKRIIAEGIVQEIRKREYHKKGSELRQEYLAERRRKIRRAKRLGM